MSTITIFECIQQSEDHYLQQLEKLQSVEEELCEETRKQRQLILYRKSVGTKIQLFGMEITKLEMEIKIKANMKSQADEELTEVNLELENTKTALYDLEKTADDEVKSFIESIQSYYDSVRLGTSILLNPQQWMKKRYEQLAHEENVMRCELMVRFDLAKEVKFLEEKTYKRQLELEKTKFENDEKTKHWYRKILVCGKKRDELKNPKNPSVIKKIEAEFALAKSENEFLMAALEVMKKESQRINKKRFFILHM